MRYNKINGLYFVSLSKGAGEYWIAGGTWTGNFEVVNEETAEARWA